MVRVQARQPISKVFRKNEKELYQCEECGLFYLDKKIAEECQKWCAQHKSCNIEIIKHAVKD